MIRPVILLMFPLQSLFLFHRQVYKKRGLKLVKLEINIDEHWPVFTLDKPKNEDGPWVTEINEDFYKEYLYFMYKYHEYQTRLQVIYEHKQREVNHTVCGYNVPEGSVIDDQYRINTIRNDASKESLRAFLSESTESICPASQNS
jgi:hypothetical protein